MASPNLGLPRRARAAFDHPHAALNAAAPEGVRRHGPAGLGPGAGFKWVARRLAAVCSRCAAYGKRRRRPGGCAVRVGAAARSAALHGGARCRRLRRACDATLLPSRSRACGGTTGRDEPLRQGGATVLGCQTDRNSPDKLDQVDRRGRKSRSWRSRSRTGSSLPPATRPAPWPRRSHERNAKMP